MVITVIVGERIKEARLRAGLTQRQLAEKLGVPYQSIGQWERGVNMPRKKTVDKLADALNVSSEYLWGYGSIDDLEDDARVQQDLIEEIEAGNIAALAKAYGSTEEAVRDLIYCDGRHNNGVRLTRSFLYSIYFNYPRSIEEVAARKKGLPFAPTMEELLQEKFALLNDDGKKRALEQVEELTEIRKYRK